MLLILMLIFSIYDLVADSYADNVNITIDDIKGALMANSQYGIRLADKSVVSGELQWLICIMPKLY